MQANVMWQIKCPDCGKGLCHGKDDTYYCDATVSEETMTEAGQSAGTKDCPARGIRFKVTGMDTSARLYLELVKEEKK